MKIAVLYFHHLGGSGIIAYELGKAMSIQQGHHIFFLGLEPPFRMRNESLEISKLQKLCFKKLEMKEQPVFVHQPYGLALASRLASLIDKEQLDIIHCHYAIPHVNSALLAREMAKKKDVGIVVTLHGTDITLVGKENTMKNVTSYLLNKCDAVVSVSNFLRNETINLFELNKKVEVIYNFLDDDFLKKNFIPLCEKKII